MVFVYFVLVNTSYVVLIALAFVEFSKHLRSVPFSGAEDLFRSPLAPSVSMIVPAFNEGPTIVPAVHALAALRYPRFEVVVVDDGSTDGSFELLAEEFGLVEVPYVMSDEVPHRGQLKSVYVARTSPDTLLVGRKENGGGKADAINIGINLARNELVCVVDADSILDHDALLAAVKPFADDPLRVAASGGVVRIVNGCKVSGGRVVDVGMPRHWLARIQVIEYLRAFLTGRTGWSRVGGLMIISGAFGVFRRDAAIAAGGMDIDVIGEDAEMVVKLHRRLRDSRTDYRIVFVAEPVSWTEAPVTWRGLAKQRRRWHRGLAEVLRKHRRMIFNPRYGRVGMVALPYFFFFELLAPFVEVAALILLPVGFYIGAVDLDFLWKFTLAAYGYGTIVSLMALLLEEVSFHRYRRWRDLLRGFGATVLENFGYRQALAPAQIHGVWQAARRAESIWETPPRTGFESAGPKP